MQGKISSLKGQVEKLHRHARQGSIGTRREYRKCMLRFTAWLEESYNLQNLRNISSKHLAAYARFLLQKGNTPGYVIKSLSAIRYYHDQLPSPRYTLERENTKLGVPLRVPPGDRAWTAEEFALLCQKANSSGNEWIADILTLQRELGLRIHEAVRLYTCDVARALASGHLVVKGKGGKVRQTIPLTPPAKKALQHAAARVRRGARLYVPEGEKAHLVIKQVQDFIRKKRPLRDGEQLTSHGLRYGYAQGRIKELAAAGVPEEKSELQVAREMGHNRRRVTRGYTR
jgi:site-specific recombinase XerD